MKNIKIYISLFITIILFIFSKNGMKALKRFITNNDTKSFIDKINELIKNKSKN